MFPFIHLFDTRVPSYLVTLLLAAVLGWILLFILLRRMDVNPIMILLILVACTIGSFIGARALAVLSDPYHVYHPFSGGIPVRYLLRYGGLSLYGALIGGIALSIIFAAAMRVPLLELIDTIAPVGQLAFGIGRIGCLLAGCCWGRPTLFPIAIVFDRFDSQARPVSVPLHATQLYEMGAAIISATVLFLVLLRVKPRKGAAFALSLLLYPSARFFLDDLRGAERIFIDGLSFMQWISLALMSLGVILLLLLYAIPSKKSGAAIMAALLSHFPSSCNSYDSTPEALCRASGDCVEGEYCVQGRCRLAGKIDVEIRTNPAISRTFEGDLILKLSGCRAGSTFASCSGKTFTYRKSAPSCPYRLELENMPRGKFLLVAAIDLDRDGRMSDSDLAGYGFVRSSRDPGKAGKPENDTITIGYPYGSLARMIEAISRDRSRMTLREFLKIWFGSK